MILQPSTLLRFSDPVFFPVRSHFLPPLCSPAVPQTHRACSCLGVIDLLLSAYTTFPQMEAWLPSSLHSLSLLPYLSPDERDLLWLFYAKQHPAPPCHSPLLFLTSSFSMAGYHRLTYCILISVSALASHTHSSLLLRLQTIFAWFSLRTDSWQGWPLGGTCWRPQGRKKREARILSPSVALCFQVTLTTVTQPPWWLQLPENFSLSGPTCPKRPYSWALGTLLPTNPQSWRWRQLISELKLSSFWGLSMLPNIWNLVFILNALF